MTQLKLSQSIVFIYQMIPETEQLCRSATLHLSSFYHQAEASFLSATHQINFKLFCLLYSLAFLTLLHILTRHKKWRARNKELKTFKERVKETFFDFVFSLPILSSLIRNKFQKALDKEEPKIILDLQKHWDHRRSSGLNVDGMNDENLRKRIEEWRKKEQDIWGSGKISGAIYSGEMDHQERMSKFAAPFLYHNPLHLDTYKEIIKMEKEVLNMTNDLISRKDPAETDPPMFYGCITSGGSESLILALYAYRNYYKRTKPNIVIPVTAHAAIDKGCFYLNIEIRKAKLTQAYQVDLKHLESLIDSNTIMIIGSAPNYPHGIIDPIDKLAKIAKRRKIGFHVDACLGGFVGAFSKDPEIAQLYSLRRDGVTSISLDHHKFALAPKGISTIFYKTKELRHAQYYINMDWKGGMYGTITFSGSRPGFASAAAWYSMLQVTKKGYKENSQIVMNATRVSAVKLRKIPGIKVFGDPEICVISFTTTEENCSHLQLSDFLNQKKMWNVSAIHKPNGIHISVTLANADNVENRLADDVREGLEYLRNKKELKKSIGTELYGTTTKIPTNWMEKDTLRLLMGASLK